MMTHELKKVPIDLNDEISSEARKITLVLPEDTIKILKSLADEKEVTMSSIATASIEYFNWFHTQKKDGFIIKAQKEIRNKIVEKEIFII